MPVTIKIAQHAASLCQPPRNFDSSSDSSSSALFKESCPNESKECKEVIQSSFHHLEAEDEDNKNTTIHSSSNGFIRGAVMAYSCHHHLIIRPDEIWFAILTQLSIYINHHAEDLRGKFVAHDDKKELEVVVVGDRYTVDHAFMADKMTHLIQKNVVDPELRAWLMPAFTTTTKKDEVVASILMMGALQKYFTYGFRYACGLPSVTLLGERADWEEILARLEKLQTFGEESTQWYRLLKPVISRFIRTFDDPQAPEISDFWAKIVNRRGGSGVDEISGWLSAFCFWKEDGKLLYRPVPAPAAGPADYTNEFSARRVRKDFQLCLDGQTYGKFDMEDVPRGYATVPIKCDDNGYEFDAVMLAGFVGIRCSSSGERTAEGQIGVDTVQAESGWLMYEKKVSKKIEGVKNGEPRVG